MFLHSKIIIKTILNYYLKIIYLLIYIKYGNTFKYNQQNNKDSLKLSKRQDDKKAIGVPEESSNKTDESSTSDPLSPGAPCVVAYKLPLLQIILIIVLIFLIIWLIIYRFWEHTKVVPMPATYGHNTNSLNIAAMYFCQIQLKNPYENNQFQRLGMIFTYSDVGRHQKLVLDKYFLRSLKTTEERQYLTFFFYTEEVIYRLRHLSIVHDGKLPVLFESVEIQNVDTPFKQACFIRGPIYNEFHELSKKTYDFDGEKIQRLDKMFRVPRNVTLIETSIFCLAALSIGVLLNQLALTVFCSNETPCFKNYQRLIGTSVGLISFIFFILYSMSFWKFVRHSLHLWFGRCLAFYTRYLWLITSISMVAAAVVLAWLQGAGNIFLKPSEGYCMEKYLETYLYLLLSFLLFFILSFAAPSVLTTFIYRDLGEIDKKLAKEISELSKKRKTNMLQGMISGVKDDPKNTTVATTIPIVPSSNSSGKESKTPSNPSDPRTIILSKPSISFPKVPGGKSNPGGAAPTVANPKGASTATGSTVVSPKGASKAPVSTSPAATVPKAKKG